MPSKKGISYEFRKYAREKLIQSQFVFTYLHWLQSEKFKNYAR